jgi:hypothetical protein
VVQDRNGDNVARSLDCSMKRLCVPKNLDPNIVVMKSAEDRV